MLQPIPTIEECALAVAEMVSVWRARHLGDPVTARLTDAEITEVKAKIERVMEREDRLDWPIVVCQHGEVLGIARSPIHQQGARWMVGLVIDCAAGTLFDVYFIRGERGVGLG